MTDFLPIDGETRELEGQPTDVAMPIAATLWLVFVILLASTPALVIATWRWAL